MSRQSEQNGAASDARLPRAISAVRAVRRSGATQQDRALVIGDGPTAELIGRALEMQGVSDITIRKAAVASAPAEELPEVLPSLCYETTGDPATITCLVERLPRYGRMVLLGSGDGATTSLDLYRTVHKSGAEIIGQCDDDAVCAEVEAGSAGARDIALAEQLLSGRGQEQA